MIVVGDFVNNGGFFVVIMELELPILLESVEAMMEYVVSKSNTMFSLLLVQIVGSLLVLYINLSSLLVDDNVGRLLDE